MINKQKIFADFEITLGSPEELINEAFSSLSYRIATLNPEMLVAAQKNNEFEQALKKAQALIPDGIGIVLLLKKAGPKNVCRQPGIEIAWKLIEKAIQENLKIALIGSTEGALQGTINQIKNTFGNFNLVYAKNGFFSASEEKAIIIELKQIAPDLTLVALPFVRQEIFLANAQLKGISIGVGGSFDVWADYVQRAPKIFQSLGMEWLWRLIKQPERLSRLLKTLWPFLKIYRDKNAKL